MGGVILTEDLESFLHKDFSFFCREIVGIRDPERFTIGGAALVALINTALLLCHQENRVRFFGAYGDDNTGKELSTLLLKTPLGLTYYICKQGPTPATMILSDPTYNGVHGERALVHNMGIGKIQIM